MSDISQNLKNEITQRGKKRQCCDYDLTHMGETICKTTFMAVYDVGKHALQNIIKHVQENGVVPRQHMNTG